MKLFLRLTLLAGLCLPEILLAQGSCNNPNGTFFTDPSGIHSLTSALAAGKCFEIDHTSPSTYCYTFRFPSSGQLQQFTVYHYKDCNGVQCTHASSSSTPTNGCYHISSGSCGMSMRMYDEACNDLGDGFKLGSGSPCNMQADRIYSLCITNNISGCCSPMYICPILGCSGSKSCGCALIKGVVSTKASAPGSNDGSATVNVTGTQHPSYLWSNGATTKSIGGLSPGNYSVSVTSSETSCTDIENFEITSSGCDLIASITTTNTSTPLSNDGSATVQVTGTQNPSYLWSNGSTQNPATGLAAGNYSVSVTASENSCTDTETCTTTSGCELIMGVSTVNASHPGASDGTAMVQVSGTQSPSYQWSSGSTQNNATGLAAGTYTVSVTASETFCTDTETFEITSGNGTGCDSLSVDFAKTIMPPCDCGSTYHSIITAKPSGGTAPYGFLWDNGSTVSTRTQLPGGTYHITISDANNCTQSDTVSLPFSF
ncbi:MAG: hypothetical protein H6585_12325 [Flavobacteriales bacterium]|nr:hypothetical protein [Flavobacteriales bacterium]MCB9449117.1 hypothetical protein [Flavobacteriales bacterium]